MSYYECLRCGHLVKQKIEMKRHLERKNKCPRNIKSYNYTDEQIIIYSLLKNNQEKKDKLIEFNNQNKFNKPKDQELTTQNTTSLIHKIEESKKNINEFICEKCNKVFSRKFNLNRHKSKCSINKSNSFNDINISNNTTNNYQTINNNYNKNLFVNFNLEPFDNEWDVSRITKFTKHSILLSKIMYSNLLNAILENEKNLNVLIEKDTNTGIVYKNNVEQFITMNITDIIDKSMEKLNKHLNDFYHESLKDDEFIIMDKIFEDQKLKIENKYQDFKNNSDVQEKVKEFITDIFDKKKEHAIKLYNNTIKNKDVDDNDGY